MSSSASAPSPSPSSKRWRSRRALPTTTGAFFPAKQIVPGLWIGSEGDSRNASFFKKHGIRFIVNATGNIPMRHPADVTAYRVPVDDHPDQNDLMLRHLPIVVVAIDDVLKHGQGVLVHCRAGMQRSAGVVAGYLMWKRGMTADQAFEFINNKKHETFWPTPTFDTALRAWETQLRKTGRIR